MLILQLISNPSLFLSFVIAFLLSLSCHEAAHAYIANKLGDPTAKLAGRLTLNPLKHVDPMGTIFLFIAGFGWGLPVPMNPSNFKNAKIDSLKVGLAGPATNLILALIFSLIYRFAPLNEMANQIVITVISLNIIWMIFNLLPIPPLDGSHILAIFISARAYNILATFGMPILFLLLIFSPYLTDLLTTGLNFFFHFFTGQPFQGY